MPLTALTDEEIYKSITNICDWLENPISKNFEIKRGDLAIGVPGECFFPELAEYNEEVSQDSEKGILIYTDSMDEKYIWLKNEWHHMEKVLGVISSKNEWALTTNLWERLLLLVLTQLDYSARESEGEVPYSCSDLNDLCYLYWQEGRPVAMASVKSKGSSIWGGEELYVCDTIDTLFVRNRYRRNGLAFSLLVTLVSKLTNGQHLALSHPVSLSMCKVLLKFVKLYPTLREKIWTLDEFGEVCGTAVLMLGSLIMSGVLQPSDRPMAVQHQYQNPAHISQNTWENNNNDKKNDNNIKIETKERNALNPIVSTATFELKNDENLITFTENQIKRDDLKEFFNVSSEMKIKNSFFEANSMELEIPQASNCSLYFENPSVCESYVGNSDFLKTTDDIHERKLNFDLSSTISRTSSDCNFNDPSNVSTGNVEDGRKLAAFSNTENFEQNIILKSHEKSFERDLFLKRPAENLLQQTTLSSKPEYEENITLNSESKNVDEIKMEFFPEKSKGIPTKIENSCCCVDENKDISLKIKSV